MSGKKGSRVRTPWRDNIEAMTVAVIMAVILKYFIVEAYKIPTGSMQPTLMGNEETGIFDRILVDKLSYTFRDPERFEVVIFKYPLNRSKNFVKRIVGMPNEWIRIAGGDVWTRPDENTPWKILRRPAQVQRAAWRRLVRGERNDVWSITDGGGWTTDGTNVHARGSGRARFAPGHTSIVDDYTDGYPEGMRNRVRPIANSGRNAVGDLRVDGTLRPMAGCRWVIVQFVEGRRVYTLRIPGPAAPEGATSEIEVTGDEGATYENPRKARGATVFRLKEGRDVRFEAQNVDDLLTIGVEGETLCQLEIDAARDQRGSAVSLLADGDGVDFGDLEVYRDIYYTTDGNVWQQEIPEGHYFMLGDNTQNSSDSRQWMWWQIQLTQEDGSRRAIQGELLQDQNPRSFFPEEGGTRVRFDDEWGESWYFDHEDQEVLTPRSAPLVSRDLITGRALLVFWPLAFRAGVYRLSWIH